MESYTQMNIIPLNTNLTCCNPIDKATLIISKKFETRIINYVSLYYLQAKFTKSSQGVKKKLRQINQLKIMKILYYERQCDPEQFQTCIKCLRSDQCANSQYTDLHSQYRSKTYTVLTRKRNNFERNYHVQWWQEATVVKQRKLKQIK